VPDITPHFTPEQVDRLNRWQFRSSDHPYTCGGLRKDEQHLDNEGVLMATANGWICPYCTYTQDSAPDFRLEEPGPNPPGSMADNLCGEEARADPTYPATLFEALKVAILPRFRGIILSIIANERLSAAIPLLIEQLSSPDPWMRYWARRVLASLNTLEAHRALREHLDPPTPPQHGSECSV
jgi:hypothetical protein